MTLLIIDPHFRPNDFLYLATASLKTIQMSLAATTLGTVLGVPLGIARSESVIVRALTSLFVDIVRTVPMIIQLILVDTFMSISCWPLSAFTLGSLTLGVWMAAVTSEIARSAHETVSPSLRRAARALGMSFWQEIYFVGFPLLLRSAFPGWIGAVLSLVKDSALLGMFGYIELTKASQILNTRTHLTFLIFCLVGAIYFSICYGITALSHQIERRMGHD